MPRDRRFDARLRRALDASIALAALFVLAPLFLVIAVAIILECGRPVFFKQVRLGEGGRHFVIYKFRKFSTRESKAGLPLTMRNDARMSHIGRVLAGTKIDEFPQFYNILRGDMSVVGPRPESLDFADCFDVSTRPILDHRPGILGPSQVAFRNEGSLFPINAEPTKFYREVLFPAKANLDLVYYRNRTLYSDLKWIILGVLAVAGLNAGGVTTPRTGNRPRTEGGQP